MTTPDPRWTPETEDIAAGTIWRGFGPLLPHLDMARSVLAALADRGLLVTPGGQSHIEAEVEYQPAGRLRGGVEAKVYRDWTPGWRVRELAAARSLGMEVVSERTRTVTTWPDGSVYNGPWTEAAVDAEARTAGAGT